MDVDVQVPAEASSPLPLTSYFHQYGKRQQTSGSKEAGCCQLNTVRALISRGLLQYLSLWQMENNADRPIPIQ